MKKWYVYLISLILISEIVFAEGTLKNSDGSYIKSISGCEVLSHDDLKYFSIGDNYESINLNRKFIFQADEIYRPQIRTIKLNNEIISGLTINGNVKFNNKYSSYAYLILLTEDKNKNIKEHLILDPFYFYSNCEDDLSYREYDFKNVGEETLFLDNEKLLYLIIVGHDSDVEIDSINIFKTSSIQSTPKSKDDNENGEAYKEYIYNQNRIKTKLINKRNKQAGFPWTAKINKFALTPFNEKKKYFLNNESIQIDINGKNSYTFYSPTHSYGFEYYHSGVFTFVPTDIESLPDNMIEWSWRNAHGQNWNTPVRSQGACGSCWAFGTIAALESRINLYYNQHIDKNLSEQDLVSCSDAGSCGGGSAEYALDYIRDTGVVDEDCFPYTASNEDCSDKCSDWTTRTWKITDFEGRNYGLLRDGITSTLSNLTHKGPLPISIGVWHHVISLVGYKYFIDEDLYGLEIKNSWGTDWGDNGYCYILIPLRVSVYFINPQVIPPSSESYDIMCYDSDSDGYCWWGNSDTKPSTCPSSCDGNDIEDCDDSDPNKAGFVNNFMCLSNDFKIDSCRDITSSGIYFVTDDFSSTSPNCINVESDNVAIYCKNHTINGDSSSTAVNINGHNNVTIEDCDFENFGNAVKVYNSDEINIAYNNFHNDNVAINLTLSDNDYIIYNNILDCGNGIYMDNSNNNFYLANYVKDSTYTGLNIISSMYNNFSYNTFCGSGSSDVTTSGENYFSGTVCSSSSDPSICEHSCSEPYDCVNLYWPDSYPSVMKRERRDYVIEGSVDIITLCNITYDMGNHHILFLPNSQSSILDCNGAVLDGKRYDYPFDDDLGAIIPFFTQITSLIIAKKGIIENCTITNTINGISRSYDPDYEYLTIRNNKIMNIYDNGNGLYLRDNVKVINNTFENLTSDGGYWNEVKAINFYDNDAAVGEITGNLIINPPSLTGIGYGIYGPMYYFDIKNNTFINVINPLYIRDYYFVNHVNIENNVFNDTYSAYVECNDHCNIINNTFNSQPSSYSGALKLRYFYNSRVSNNTFNLSNSGRGIYLYGGSSNNQIDHNIIYGSSSNNYGIYVGSSSSNNNISNNVILNNHYGLYLTSDASSNTASYNTICNASTYDIYDGDSTTSGLLSLQSTPTNSPVVMLYPQIVYSSPSASKSSSYNESQS